jgi:hypothetical protein
MRRTIVSSTLLLVLIVAGCSHTGHAYDTKWSASYNNIHDLAVHSDVVAAGTVTKEIGHATDPNGITRTDFEFTISRALKAAAGKPPTPGSTITLHQTGGKDPSGNLVQAEDDPVFTMGEAATLFLHEYEPGKYYVIGGPNGRFKTTDKTKGGPAGSDTVTPLNAETVKFTGSLDQLAAEVAKP